tara:strand:- start:174 stop:1052 length:879 start_codon:yes stop_codon:yes gene_type:complete
MEEEIAENCRICDNATRLKWPTYIPDGLDSDCFAITNAAYGQTSAIFECNSCGFRQCNNLTEVLSFYEELEDPGYEAGRKERSLQAAANLRRFAKFKPGGRLLDVGSGIGMLVEEALKMGYEASGVEPSKWLQQQASSRNLSVIRGTLDDISETEKFDAIALIDVVEHVLKPIDLLVQIRNHLTPDGMAMVVTPDYKSFFGRILGRKWWHYRVAHIGYFDKKTLRMACDNAGLEIIDQKRPGWYFTVEYLWVRIMLYFPKWLRIPSFAWMSRTVIPINLRDSLVVIVRRSED